MRYALKATATVLHIPLMFLLMLPFSCGGKATRLRARGGAATRIVGVGLNDYFIFKYSLMLLRR